MPTQTNNILILDKDASSPYRGSPRTIGATDEIVLEPASFTLGTSTALSFASGGSGLDVQAPDINIGTIAAGDEANQTIDIGSAGTVVSIDVKDNQSNAFSISDASGNNYLAISTTNNAEQITLSAGTMFEGSPVGVKVVAGESLSQGDVVAVDSSGNPSSQLTPKVKKSICTSTDSDERLVFGVVTSSSISSGNSGYAASMNGTVCAVTFKGASSPTAGSLGSPVYLSNESGKAQMSAPTSGSVVKIGTLLSETAVSGSMYAVQLQVQFIAELP